MNVERFLATRANEWSELDVLVQRARGRAERLPPHDVLRLGTLYRSAAADLASIRREAPDALGTLRLQALVSSAHGLVYGKLRRHDTVRSFVTTRFWTRVRAAGPCLALSIGVMVAATAAGAVWAHVQPAAAVGILPVGFHASSHPGVGGVVRIAIPARVGLALSIMTNNIQVAALALLGGFTLGVLTVYVLAFNSALLGVLGALELRAGGFDQFVRLIVPHGLLELSCIAVAGAAGLVVARALIDPGRSTRAAALRARVPMLGDLVLGVAACLVVAGLTEGIVTTWDLPLAAAVGVGVLWGGGFWVLVAWRGAKGRTTAVTAAPAASA